jgi:sialate O-acetylesterase
MKQLKAVALAPLATACLAVAWAQGAPAFAQAEAMRPSPLFSDHMVFAECRPVRIFGTGNGVAEASFLGETANVISKSGQWLVELPQAKAGGPYELRLKLNGKAMFFADVYVGETYLISEQSNMQFILDRTPIPIEEVQGCPLIRGFFVDNAEEREFLKPHDGWTVLTKENAVGWSALGYHFAHARARARPGVAIGVVKCAQGASVIESWMPEKLAADPRFAVPAEKKHQDHTHKVYGRWNRPGRLYHLMFERLLPYSFSRAVWYQGESNTGSIEEANAYGPMLEAMVAKWRADLKDSGLPFTIIGIADFSRRDDAAWHGIQQAQENAARRIPGATFVKSADIPDPEDIHPRDKLPLAKRISDGLSR